MSEREKIDMATRRQIVVEILAQAALDLRLGNPPTKPRLEGPLRKTAWVVPAEPGVDQRSPGQEQPGDRR